MSTSAVITDGTTGRENFADGYPSWLGVELFALYHQSFDGDLDAMIKALITDHDAGWSSLFGPREVEVIANPWPAEAFEFACFENENGPRCYCHGEREEPGWDYGDGQGGGWSWVYTLRQDGLRVQGGLDQVDVVIPWDDPSPVWPADD
jgi:hypothetical protein